VNWWQHSDYFPTVWYYTGESRLLGPDYLEYTLSSFISEMLLVIACHPREPFLGGMSNTRRNEQYKRSSQAP
jgi:hypothetical protein